MAEEKKEIEGTVEYAIYSTDGKCIGVMTGDKVEFNADGSTTLFKKAIPIFKSMGGITIAKKL